MTQLQKIKKKIFGSDLVKNIITLFTGTALSQAIPLLVAPIIARIYSEGDFAVLADYVSIFGLISVLSTGRYSLSIVVAKNEKKAIGTTLLSIYISIFVSIITLLIILIFRNQIASLLNNKELSVWLLFLPVGILFFGLFETFSYFLNRNNLYKRLSMAKISRASSTGVINIVLGKIGLRNAGLVLGFIIGDVFAAIVSGFKLLKSKELFKYKFSFKELKQIAYEYKNFPLFNSLQAFSDKIRESGVILIISAFFTDKISGAYFFGFKYARAPLMLMTYVLFQVFYSKFSEKKNAGEKLFPLLKKLIKYAIPVALAIFITLFFGGEFLFKIIFGEKWTIAGYYISILAPFIALNLISGSISFLPLVIDKQKQFLFVALIYNLSVPATIYIVSKYYHDIVSVVFAQSLLSSLSLLWITLWIIYSIIIYDKRLPEKTKLKPSD